MGIQAGLESRGHSVKGALLFDAYDEKSKTGRKNGSGGFAPKTLAHLKNTFYSEDQINALLVAVKDEPLYPLIRITAIYGLRRSEALGLKWDNGVPLRPDYITMKFRKLLKQHKLPHIRFHDLRHSCAPPLISKGFGLKDVQEWLGYADITMTANIYSHLDLKRKQAIAQSMADTVMC